MQLTIDNAVVGLKIKCLYRTSYVEGKIGTISAIYFRWVGSKAFDITWDDGYPGSRVGWILPANFEVIGSKIYRKPKKIIPDIPLDPTLPILMAGHFQDRMRKKF